MDQVPGRWRGAPAGRTILISLVAALLATVASSVVARAGTTITTTVTAASVNCAAFTVSGNPQSTTGATWTYTSTDAGVRYALEGVLFAPAGSGAFPGVVVSHGKGGTPRGYSARIARTMAGWGMVAIGPMYTHAPDSEDLGNAPDGPDGASQANVLRAHKARDLLSCLGTVDLTRLAAHGHSMGAYVTGELLGTYPSDFRAASHTAGGVSQGLYATHPPTAAKITTPYQLHHGDSDQTVPLRYDQDLDGILTASGTAHELRVYPGYDHGTIAFDSTMLSRVRAWYQTYGVL